MTHWPIVGLLLASCAAPQLPAGVHPWREPEAHIVVAVDAPECAFWTVRNAWEYLSPGVPVTITRGVPLNPKVGEIVVAWSDPDGSALGLTTQWGDARTWAESRKTIRALVQVQRCDVRIVAHELGHALGLLNVDRPGALMHLRYWDGQGWELDRSERAVLRSAGQ